MDMFSKVNQLIFHVRCRWKMDMDGSPRSFEFYQCIINRNSCAIETCPRHMKSNDLVVFRRRNSLVDNTRGQVGFDGGYKRWRYNTVN